MISKKDVTYHLKIYEKEKRKSEKELLAAQILYSELTIKKDDNIINADEEEKRLMLSKKIADLKEQMERKKEEIRVIQRQYYEPLFDEIMERKCNPSDIRMMMDIVDEIQKKDDNMKGYKKTALLKKIKTATLRELEKEIYNV